MIYKCPNCGFTFDTKVEKDQDFMPDDYDYINVDSTGATCWRCDYSSEFIEESWRVKA